MWSVHFLWQVKLLVQLVRITIESHDNKYYKLVYKSADCGFVQGFRKKKDDVFQLNINPNRRRWILGGNLQSAHVLPIICIALINNAKSYCTRMWNSNSILHHFAMEVCHSSNHTTKTFRGPVSITLRPIRVHLHIYYLGCNKASWDTVIVRSSRQ